MNGAILSPVWPAETPEGTTPFAANRSDRHLSYNLGQASASVAHQKYKEPVSETTLTLDWAKQYYLAVKSQQKTKTISKPLSNVDLTLVEGNRSRTVHKLQDSLKVVCQIAWHKVDNLLEEDFKYLTNEDLVYAEAIMRDSCFIYNQVIEAFANYEQPAKLSIIVGRDLIKIREKYCQTNPLLLGLVSMQFHYVGENLLSCLSEEEKFRLSPYLKVVDDYICLPFGDIHRLILNYNDHSPILLGVQHLLQQMTSIANQVYERVSRLNQNYRSRNGLLKEELMRQSSIRDIELFLSYICLCALEGSMRPVQEELFPLCVMLYPKLHISVKLVRDLLLTLFWEIRDRLSNEEIKQILPYFKTINKMFSEEVFVA